MLAKAIETYSGLEKLREAENLDGVRNYMLDLIEATKGAVGPDSRAKMIRLQSKPAPETFPFSDLSNLIVEPVTLVAGSGIKRIALTQNAILAEWLDAASDVIEKLIADGVYQNGEWRLLCRGAITYQGGKAAYDCLAISMITNNAMHSKAFMASPKMR